MSSSGNVHSILPPALGATGLVQKKGNYVLKKTGVEWKASDDNYRRLKVRKWNFEQHHC